MFTLILSDGIIYNQKEFLDFLIANQGKAITISTNGEGACLTAYRVYQLIDQFSYADVCIFTSNILEAHDEYKIKKVVEFQWFNKFDNHLEDYSALHTWDQSKIFGCFYNRPAWHRIGLAANLKKYFENISLINFRRDPHDEDQRKLFDIKNLFVYHPDSVKLFGEMFDRCPMLSENASQEVLYNVLEVADCYRHFLIDIVAETWIEGLTFAPTEKTVRPMLLKKPMVIMGPKDYLCYLHQMGFKTFNDFWSEEYDGYETKDRYVKILELIHSLGNKSTQELNSMYNNMQHILDHNYNLIKQQNYNINIKHIL